MKISPVFSLEVSYYEVYSSSKHVQILFHFLNKQESFYLSLLLDKYSIWK